MQKILEENPGLLELIEKESENIIQMSNEEKNNFLNFIAKNGMGIHGSKRH